MEKAVLLQILDSSWMEHLRAMDHLRSSIGLQGYAQIDPKVEYKREGMRIFAEMWNGIGDRVTDLIFRVEQFDPEFLNYLGSQWKLDRAQTIHQQAESQLAAERGPGRRPPAAGRRHRRQPAVHREETRSRSATLQKRSVATTPARADPVKNSKPAACANNPRATILTGRSGLAQFSHSLMTSRLSSRERTCRQVGSRGPDGDMICSRWNDLGAQIARRAVAAWPVRCPGKWPHAAGSRASVAIKLRRPAAIEARQLLG